MRSSLVLARTNTFSLHLLPLHIFTEGWILLSQASPDPFCDELNTTLVTFCYIPSQGHVCMYA